jgi:hypothetical protein
MGKVTKLILALINNNIITGGVTMKTTITGARQMELTVKLGHMLVNKQTKLKNIVNAQEARRSKIFLEDEIEDLNYIITCNCKPTIIKEVYNYTMSNDIKTILKNYI